MFNPLASCEFYMQDENRFASKGAHLNLKRAERARAAINKLPGIFRMPISVINNIKEKLFLQLNFDTLSLSWVP